MLRSYLIERYVIIHCPPFRMERRPVEENPKGSEARKKSKRNEYASDQVKYDRGGT
jgi:hypothetical protein